MDCLPKNDAQRHYVRRFVPAMTMYVVLLFAAVRIFTHYHPVGALAYVIAILPALPIIAIIVIVGLYLGEEKDEFKRALLIQSMVWSIGATLVVTTVWGFLENFVQLTHLQPYLIAPLFWFLVGISTPLLKRRYR